MTDCTPRTVLHYSEIFLLRVSCSSLLEYVQGDFRTNILLRIRNHERALEAQKDDSFVHASLIVFGYIHK